MQNGTNSTVTGPASGRANDIQHQLAGLGYSAAATTTVLTSQADTTLTYHGADRRGDALAVAKALGLPKSAVRESSSVSGLQLVIGNDWRAGTAYPKTSGNDKPADKAPASADALNGESKGCMQVNPDYTF
ncbi:LytR C-terminal domain-containing protein [Streptomyces endophytica]|uniref:LytR C-terminal domain-containing protein n=1 Tax=Streptomyces endophytica TaxID=2991496 RepID=UPI00311B06DE